MPSFPISFIRGFQKNLRAAKLFALVVSESSALGGKSLIFMSGTLFLQGVKGFLGRLQVKCTFHFLTAFAFRRTSYFLFSPGTNVLKGFNFRWGCISGWRNSFLHIRTPRGATTAITAETTNIHNQHAPTREATLPLASATPTPAQAPATTRLQQRRRTATVLMATTPETATTWPGMKQWR